MSRTSTPDDAMMRKQQDADLRRDRSDSLARSVGALEEDGARITSGVGSGRGQAASRPSHGLEGSETEQAMKRAAATVRQNRTIRRRG